MTDKLLPKVVSGKFLSEFALRDLEKRVGVLKQRGVQPRLDIVLVGKNPASEIYVERKISLANDLGIQAEIHKFPQTIKEGDLLKKIDKLNSDEHVHAILIQLPLPKHLNERRVVDCVCPEKDVDGLTTYNLGNLFAGEAKFEPCTPKGIIRMLEMQNVRIPGKNVVVVGRSNLVGKPLSMMFLKRNATVTLCHSKTKNLKEHTKNADILVVAAGKPKLITGDMVKDNAFVIDVGINRVGKRIVGDVDFDSVEYKVSHITPVPGGVGPLTVVSVIENTIISAERRVKK